MTRQRRLVHYSGRVQGVGFRYTTKRVAAGHAVDGYVRNLPDGRVEMVAEGDITELDALLEEIAREMSGYIRHVQCDVSAATGQFQGFQVRY
jgi:acylphosphatase